MSIQYLNPVQAAEVIPARSAPRLTSLEGATVGLLANGKTNARTLMSLIADELKSRCGVQEVIERTKGHPSSNCQPELLDELARRCDAVITGLGD